jgi:hypothetical protein
MLSSNQPRLVVRAFPNHLMPTTLDQLESFHGFARHAISAGQDLSLEEYLHRWRTAYVRAETNSALREAIEEMENGLGQPVCEAIEDIRRELGLPAE